MSETTQSEIRTQEALYRDCSTLRSTTAAALFHEARGAMLVRLATWIKSQPVTPDLNEEVEGTINAIRSLVELGAGDHG